MQDFNEFRKGIEFTLDWETAKGTRIYVNDPKDKGGETKWGISKRAHPDLDIKNLTREQAIDIYAKEYWDGCGCDNIPFPLNCAVFDVAVMSGQGTAARLARDAKDVGDFFDKRRQFLIDITRRDPSQKRYLDGWLNRTNDLKKFVDICSPKPEAPKPTAPVPAPTAWELFKKTLAQAVIDAGAKYQQQKADQQQ